LKYQKNLIPLVLAIVALSLSINIAGAPTTGGHGSMGGGAPSFAADPTSYESLRQQVLHRDSWRCQLCGTMSNLEVHHKEFRSHSGDDSEQNLITLCSACHASVHEGKRAFVFLTKKA